MKFSSEDVAQQRFEVRFRGFDVDQVREFLIVIARELDELAMANRTLTRELDGAQKELADYRKRERSLHDALELARETAKEIETRAERAAEVRVAQAELESEQMLTRAREAAEEEQAAMRELREQRHRAVAELRATLEMHLHLLDSQKLPAWAESQELDRPQ